MKDTRKIQSGQEALTGHGIRRALHMAVVECLTTVAVDTVWTVYITGIEVGRVVEINYLRYGF